MSQGNVEMALVGLDAFIQRDVEAVIALMDPECVWYPAFAGIMEGPYRGHAEMRQYFEDLAEFADAYAAAGLEPPAVDAEAEAKAAATP